MSSLLDALLLDPFPFDVYFACRTDGISGSGTLHDPYNWGSATLFDERMNLLPEGTTVHLGPGTFETHGYADARKGSLNSCY